MLKPTRCAILLALAAASPLAAQRQVFVVDAGNGPGTSFTDLPAAVAAANNGDLLLVRPGDYTSFETQKGLTILGGNGVRIARAQPTYAPAVVVSGLPSNETFTLYGFQAASTPFLVRRVEIRSCAGKVHLESITLENTGSSAPNGVPCVQLESSASVYITRSSLRGQPGVLARNSTLVATDTVCAGSDGALVGREFPSGHGIRAESSQITLSRCHARGGSSNFTPFQTEVGSGLSSQLSTWTILGDQVTSVIAGSAPGRAASAMSGDGSVRKNPIVGFVPSGGAPPIALAISVLDVEIPSMRAQGAPLGGNVLLDLFGMPGDAFALFVGLPGDPVPLGTLGELWMDPRFAPIFARGGTIDATRHFSMSVPVPRDPLVLGARFTWQSAAGSIAHGFFLSNPATHVQP